MFATPIYFNNISGQLNLFFDRLSRLSKRKLTGRRVAAFVMAYVATYNHHYTKHMSVIQNYLNWFSGFLGSTVVAAHSMAKRPHSCASPKAPARSSRRRAPRRPS